MKKVVITSSIAVLDIDRDEATVSATDLAPVPDPHNAFANSFAGYSASKKIALDRTAAFLAENKPSFDVIHILPSVIIGRNELASSPADFASGTNRHPINIARGVDAPNRIIGATVHVDDCALIHVRALDPTVVQGTGNFIASAGSVRWGGCECGYCAAGAV